MIRLNLGCGPVVAHGWWNCDSDYYPDLDWQGDMTQGLPLEDGCADGAVSHHALQMVPYLDLVPFLAEVRRVLKPGAWLRMTLPDLPAAVSAWGQRNRSWFPVSRDMEPKSDGALCLYLTQAGATRSVFTDGWAEELCLRAGYEQAVASSSILPTRRRLCPEWLAELDCRLGESIVVEARR